MAAHLFIVYYAAMATMTPPVALAAYTAAGIADADPMKVGWTAVKIGIVAFIIPYVFVYQPQIILQGHVGWDMLLSIMFTLFAVVALAGGLNQYLFRIAKKYEMVLLFIAAILMLVPYYIPNCIGFAILVVIAVLQYKDKKKGIGLPIPPLEQTQQ